MVRTTVLGALPKVHSSVRAAAAVTALGAKNVLVAGRPLPGTTFARVAAPAGRSGVTRTALGAIGVSIFIFFPAWTGPTVGRVIVLSCTGNFWQKFVSWSGVSRARSCPGPWKTGCVAG